MKSKKISTVISAVIILLAVVAVLGFIAYLANGGTGNAYSFYLICEERKIYTSAGDFLLEQGEPMRVDIKYADEAVSGYSVKVVPNTVPGKDFDFLVNGDVYSFQSEPDLTAGFDIEMSESSFTIKPKGGVMDILSAVYPNATVDHLGAQSYDNMFTLIVTSHDGSASITLNFEVNEFPAGVYLDKEVIIF